jgi:hypothetical protein
MTRRATRPRLCALALGILSVACHGPTAAPPTPASGSEPSLEPLIRATSPSEVNPHFDGGQDVFITNAGIRPHVLSAVVGYELIFHNLTDSTVTVRARNTPVFASDPIPPGGTFVYMPVGPISVVYASRPVGGIGKVQFSFPMAPYAPTPDPNP